MGFVMSKLHYQLKCRRKDLGLTQADMKMRVGITRQQYQRLEANGNPRLDTLELVAKGLKSEVMLIPQEKLLAVMAILKGDVPAGRVAGTNGYSEPDSNPMADDPWAGLMGDAESDQNE
jgi:DNA-binding XRE family transcriptional regulator